MIIIDVYCNEWDEITYVYNGIALSPQNDHPELKGNLIESAEGMTGVLLSLFNALASQNPDSQEDITAVAEFLWKIFYPVGDVSTNPKWDFIISYELNCEAIEEMLKGVVELFDGAVDSEIPPTLH